jgi:hypothetical protein
MKYLALVFVIILASCGNKKDAAKGEDMSLEIIVSSFYSQSSYPGVESNLRSTTIYKCDFTVNTKVPFEIIELLVDSVKLPVSSLNMNGDIMKNDHVKIVGDSVHVIFQASRMFFSAEAQNQIFDIVEYEKSGVILEGKAAFLNVLIDGQVQRVDLGEFEKKQSVFHP